MSREIQLRDKEILDMFDSLAAGSPSTEALLQEVSKRCDCTAARIDEAIKAADSNGHHLYWKN